jgi:hypothetical protein
MLLFPVGFFFLIDLFKYKNSVRGGNIDKISYHKFIILLLVEQRLHLGIIHFVSGWIAND